MKGKVTFIGAGNVAWNLSHALHESGYRISGISSRKKSSAKKLAAKFRCAFTTEPTHITQNSDIVFITTPDSAINEIVTALCAEKSLNRNQLIVHTSGLLSVKAMHCVKKCGAIPLSMHPAFSFSSPLFKKNEFKGVYFVLEGSSTAVEKGKRIVRNLGGKSIIIARGMKPLYHIALVFASNLFVGIEDMAVNLLSQCGIEEKDARNLIKPLVEVTEKNIWEKGTLKALTGPVEREDVETVKKHLSTLTKYEHAYKKVYTELSKHLVTMVEKKGEVDKKTLWIMRKMLSD